MKFLADAPSYQSATVAAAQSNADLVAAVAGKRIILVAGIICADAATTIAIGSGANALGPPLALAAGVPLVLLPNGRGWFRTDVGEALTVDTGAGGAIDAWLDYVLDV